MTDKDLMNQAIAAKEYAYVPYSQFAVGAAVLTEDGKVFTGCNIENASYGLTNCAERTAVFKAISEGHTHLSAIAVAAGTEKPVSPCGACRQVLSEFLPRDGKLILGNLKGDTSKTTIKELLPGAFEAGDFRDEPSV